MKTFIEPFRKHIILFGLLVIFWWLGAWILSAYTSHNEASAAAWQVDVSVSAFPTPDIVSDGDSAAFLIYYQTQGNGTAGWIQVSATLDAGLSIVSAVPNTYSINGSVVTWTGLPDNYGPILLEVTVNGSEWDTLSLQATVSTTSDDSNLSNNTINTSIGIIDTQANDLYSDLSVTTASYSDTVSAGDNVNYVLNYTNNGWDDAGEVVIVTSLPSDLVYATSSIALDPTSTDDTLVWRLTDVANGQWWSISFTTVASNLLEAWDTIFVYSAISSANTDTNIVDNQTSATITIDAAAKVDTDTNTNTNTNQGAPSGGGGGWAGDAGSNDVAPTTPTTSSDDIITQEENTDNDMPLLSWFVPVSTITNTMNLRTVDTCAPAEELFAAYTFAFDKSITTMKNIADARMCDGVSRIELSKMITNYAINVLKKSPNTNIVCSFDDVSGQSEEMQWYTQKICQLGIMWLEQDGSPAQSFNPTQKVDRATFSTAFSRLLYGSKNNVSSWSWYAKHIQALKDAGILKNTDPTILELRWYIMLMMMRSSTAK